MRYTNLPEAKMSSLVSQRKTCRLCGSRNLELVLKLAPTPSGDAYVPLEKVKEIQQVYPLSVLLCRDCGHAQLSDVVNPEILYSNYIYTTSISLGLAEHFRQYAEAVLSSIKPSMGALVIDIGSNDGTLLEFFQKQGMRVLGIDPASHLAAKVTESGIETIADFFTADLAVKARSERGPAAIVTANNVFANIDELDDMIKGIRRLMAPDGVFVFETSYLLDVIQKTLIETFFHEHLSYFSVKPLQAFFKRYGMELIDVERVATKGGSLRCTVQLAGGPRKISSSVAELIAVETHFGLQTAQPFKDFANRLNAGKNELHALLGELKARGKSIAGYGASVGVTTIIYEFDIAGFLSFLIDDNPSRHRLFSPGYHIPVLSSQVIYERKPDYVVILAWGYAEPIMRKNQEYIKEGGHFILPLPEVKVI